MSTYVLMTRLAPGAVKHADERRAAGRSWLEKVKQKVPGVRFVAHYAIFGPYDYMDIYESDDPEASQRVALISRSEGALTAETWQAMPYDRFLELMGKID